MTRKLVLDMRIFDAHCDVLYKMYLNPTIQFYDDPSLHVTLKSLKQAHVKVQAFAIYVPESVGKGEKFEAALSMVELFYKNIIDPFSEMKLVQTQVDILQLQKHEIGALLTLEGCDCIRDDLVKLKTLMRLGVSAVGLTWNVANAVADGVLEERGAGVSSFGKKVINILNEEKISCDVSHLSKKAFWDVIEYAQFPFASHSNSYTVTPHQRNLTDAQIKALIEKNSVIGVTFVPQFLTNKQQAHISDVLHHIDYICSLGGENHIGFGSDFDGTDETVVGLQSAREYEQLVNELLKNYSTIFVEKVLFRNMCLRIPSK